MRNVVFQHPREESGALPAMPLGGLGAGSLCLGPDARFRNMALNNNRRAEEVVPLLPHSFFAIRAESELRSQVRILQQVEPGDPNDSPARRFEDHHILRRASFPATDFQFMAPDFPVQITWSAFAPVIPFDYDAATMPVVFFSIRVRNLLSLPVSVSVLFNWENCAGIGQAGAPLGSSAMPLQIDHEEHRPQSQRKTAPGGRAVEEAKSTPKKGDAKSEEGDYDPAMARFNAIQFLGDECKEGPYASEHCIAIDSRQVNNLSVYLWDPELEADWAELWSRFKEEGTLLRALSAGDRQAAGAICAGVELAANGETRLDYVLSWYAYDQIVHGHSLGHGYGNRIESAPHAAQQAIKRVAYYFRSVEDWQRRLNSASVPRWLGKMLLNTCALWTTNSLHTADGRFHLLEDSHAWDGLPLRYRLFSSVGILLFFPRFEENEMGLIAQAIEEKGDGRIPTHFDAATAYAPAFSGTATEQAFLASQFVILSYRNFSATASLNRLRTLYPAIQKVLLRLMDGPARKRGLPAFEEASETLDGIAVKGLDIGTASLWCVALRAYAALSKHLGDKAESGRALQLAERALASLEHEYWDEETGCYSLGPKRLAGDQQASARCHESQLLGHWASVMLGLGPLLSGERVRRILERLSGHRKSGAHSTVEAPGETPACPPLEITPLACVNLYAGQFDAGLALLESQYRKIHYGAGLAYTLPLRWDGRSQPDSRPSGHPAHLSLWHVLYALEGISLNVPAGHLRLSPRLPQNMHTLDAPIFLPSCFGWMRFQEDNTGGYRQRFRLNFDSPIRIEVLQVQIPGDLPGFDCVLETNDGAAEVDCSQEGSALLIRPRRKLTGVTELNVQLQRRELPKGTEEKSS